MLKRIVGTIIDNTTNAPIPFVAIQTAEFKGVISNEEGVFVIDLKDIDSKHYRTDVFRLPIFNFKHYRA